MRESPLAIAPHHAAFAGHFPGHPVVPAVVLLAETLAAVAAETGRAAHQWRLAHAKFTRPVGPGVALVLVRETLAAGALRFEIRDSDGLVASGQLAPAP